MGMEKERERERGRERERRTERMMMYKIVWHDLKQWHVSCVTQGFV